MRALATVISSTAMVRASSVPLVEFVVSEWSFMPGIVTAHSGTRGFPLLVDGHPPNGSGHPLPRRSDMQPTKIPVSRGTPNQRRWRSSIFVRLAQLLDTERHRRRTRRDRRALGAWCQAVRCCAGSSTPPESPSSQSTTRSASLPRIATCTRASTSSLRSRPVCMVRCSPRSRCHRAQRPRTSRPEGTRRVGPRPAGWPSSDGRCRGWCRAGWPGGVPSPRRSPCPDRRFPSRRRAASSRTGSPFGRSCRSLASTHVSTCRWRPL